MNKALRVLTIYNGVFGFASGLLGPLYAVYVQGLEKSIFSVSVSWSAFWVSATLFMMIISKVGDRIKEKEYLLMAGYLIRAVVWFAFAFIHTIPMLVLLQLLLGLGQALGTPGFDSLFASHTEKDKQVAEYANWQIISHITTAVSAVVGGFMVEQYGFPVLFFTMSALALVSFFGILIKPRSLL